jgi:uncharacterized membrane protein YkoI
MIRKNALLMASGLTAFILVLVGGVAARASEGASAQAAQADAQAAVVDEAALAGIMQEREAAYREMIDQANQMLAATATTEPAATYPISADTAVAIVLTTVRGGTLEQPPELVDYMGAAAYEVSLVQGLVYVDANTGKILANGAIPQIVVVTDDSSNDDGSSGGGARHEDDDHDEHEDEHHDDEKDDD